MQIIDPPDGRPWALLLISGSSLVLNVVLGAALLLRPSAPADETPYADVAQTEQAEGIDAGAPLDAVASVDAPAPSDAQDGDAVAMLDAEPVGAAPALPAGLKVASATVERNLAYTFDKAVGEGSDALSATTARLFVWDLDLRRDLQKGDEVAVAWQIEADLPVIQAATYRSLKLGTTLTAYRFQAEGDAYPSYWSAEGVEVPHTLVNGPLKGGYEQITSLLKDRPTHKGMDFKTPVGTPVVTPMAGRVVRTDWNFTYNGNCVEVRWADGTLARFLHLSETSVKPEQTVAAGTVLGKTGNTGRSTAPHLHYELEKADRVIDPVDRHGTIRRELSASDKARFQGEVERLQGLLGRGV